MQTVISVVGARPNFMKIAPIHFEFLKYKDKIRHLICHTGQHYDEKMSKIFFDELGLPTPDFYLGIGSGSHAVQTAGIMVAFEKILLEQRPDLVIVAGDVNSTIACSLVAKKMHIPVAHVEAGLRSFDREMPEEINRILTDAISDLLFVTEESGLEHLKKEGIDASKVFFTGNVMIDSLVSNLSLIDASGILQQLELPKAGYLLATIHRPSNVDTPESLSGILRLLNKYAQGRKVLFPVHPRTRSNIRTFGLEKDISPELILTEPIGYIDFLCLVKNARLIITDSGGIQEESTYLGIPCVTLRDNTERPITVKIGTNYLAGTDMSNADRIIAEVLGGNVKKGSIPELWDGKAAERICQAVYQFLM
ncbi:UDP-N-acetylglucosamine 2-epimerase (non-hydrolyzing) [Flavitalea sp. BT771]|uniref:non-hydrolyzing UDP-N-acetylglucosamine 2-epimerase n=1 Tax=Flavitalea sp. BT771 TaxID=3063329 RepID=UPI0026E3B3CB|nr:UDP-N-acetylglucosamine 2-epimerase (non-hydrolyzing) [Flavitalea sp. BT771]MDO6435541.1 UDP-N-acetylglucosamine 2-epimerase (non-hydrolyzing) [Flavitalea sp. BT771]MDV6224441.1 UDP-N-acetylglucosamine 2-epimerase (non-hydrolyzing) [Flavitalea sp. BT771]